MWRRKKLHQFIRHTCTFVCFAIVSIIFKIFFFLRGGGIWFGLWFLMYFSYIMVVSFFGGRNRSTWRKPQSCCKSL